MIINVKVNPRSRFEKVIQISDREFEISFNVPPEKGKANEKLIKLLAAYFKVPKSEVIIRLGKTAREKVIEIEGVIR